LSSVFPPLSIEHEKPSLASFIGHNRVKLSSENFETFESDESDANAATSASVAKVIDSTLQKKSNPKSQQSENSDCENSISTSINFSNYSSSSVDKVEENGSVSPSAKQEGEENQRNLQLCHNHHPRESSSVSEVNLADGAKAEQELPVKEKKSEKLKTDTNNNRETVCNQNSNSTLSSLTLSHSLLRNLAKLNQVDDRAQSEEENLKFLSPHTSQRKFPPEFYSSTNSLNQDVSFEASSRLKRLEERFKGFSYTKKLLRSSKVFSKSEEILSSIGRGDEEFQDPLNSSHSASFPLSPSSTLSENCLRQLTDKAAVCNNNNVDDVKKNQFQKRDSIRRRTSYLADEISGEFDTIFPPSSSFSPLRIVIEHRQ
jgi:hypothetical protein